MGEEYGLSSLEENEAKNVRAAQNGNIEAGKPYQFSNNSAIRWERFLPIRSLKVLLVENDDSTRHVVSALLRNCSYEVTTAGNGFQAWKILENTNTQVDLVLTEVVMPVLSGIGLLTKIMSHKARKNIPVIMMSSHDSMGIVFKCLSKGAVDFLVKPIRKNELKNLWQHVWRRCHSSSGSESGTEAKYSAKLRNSGNDSEWDDDTSLRDESDNGSDTQGSWTNKKHGGLLLADAPADSTCAQVISAKPQNDENDDTVLSETPAVGSHGRETAYGLVTLTKNDRICLQDISAFSKYNTASSPNQGLTGNVGSCSANQQSNGSSNNDIASSAKNQKSEISSGKKSMYSSSVHPTPNGRVSCPVGGHVADFSHALQIEGTAGNYSMNGSGSGSNNVQKVTFPSLVTNENATEDANMVKLRQKRKERCFDKKVRHQNRKKLAEQRPRPKGQFTRQSLSADGDV